MTVVYSPPAAGVKVIELGEAQINPATSDQFAAFGQQFQEDCVAGTGRSASFPVERTCSAL